MNRYRVESDEYGQAIAVFDVSTETAGTVFMTVRRTGEQDSNRAIVFVEAGKIVELWKSEPYNCEPELAYGDEAAWRNDRKFAQAERGFSFGKRNPVPLASIECSTYISKTPIWQKKYLVFKECVGVTEKEVSYVGFINGITRTIWLLANKAETFPIECSLRSAELLQQKAGVTGSTYITVADLYKET